MLGAECRDLRTILPIRIHRYENARGFGRRAGSIAAVQASATEVDVLVPAEKLLRGEGARRPSGRGVQRRRMGREGVSTGLRFRTGDEHDLPQYGVLQLDPCRIVIEASAGGGWGDPRQRDPQAVLRDVRDGIITLAPRWMSYGVEISACGRSIVSTAGRIVTLGPRRVSVVRLCAAIARIDSGRTCGLTAQWEGTNR